MAKTYSRYNMPPCPDPEKHIAVKMGNKFMWRRKRGTVKPARLNAAFQRNANNTKISSPAASNIVQKLAPFLNSLETGRLVPRIGGRLKRALNETGTLDYSYMKGFEIQEKWTMASLLRAPYKLAIRDEAVFSIDLTENSVKPQNKFSTNYFLELIMLHGDPASLSDLRIETDVSEMIPFDETFNKDVALSLLIPEERPWMLLLHLSCMEGNERGILPRHHRLVVIGTGKGRVKGL